MQSKKYETGPSVSISHAAKEPLSDLVGNIGVPSIGQQQLDVLVTPPQRSHMEGCKTLGRPGATTQHNTNHRRHHPHHTKCPSNRRQQHCECWSSSFRQRMLFSVSFPTARCTAATPLAPTTSALAPCESSTCTDLPDQQREQRGAF